MKKKSTIVRHSLSQIRAMRQNGEDQTSPDAPEAKSLGAGFWNTARAVAPAAQKTGKKEEHRSR